MVRFRAASLGWWSYEIRPLKKMGKHIFSIAMGRVFGFKFLAFQFTAAAMPKTVVFDDHLFSH